MSNPNRRPTAREKIADWTLAYHVMLEEMVASVPDAFVPAPVIGKLSSMKAQRPLTTTEAGEYTVIEGHLIRDRRTAALAAAILVANAGVERAVVAVTEDDSDG